MANAAATILGCLGHVKVEDMERLAWVRHEFQVPWIFKERVHRYESRDYEREA